MARRRIATGMLGLKTLRITIGEAQDASVRQMLDHLNRVRAGVPSDFPVTRGFATWKQFFEHFDADRLEVLSYIFRHEPISAEAVIAGLQRDATADIDRLIADGDVGQEADGRLWYDHDQLRAEILMDYPSTSIEIEPIRTEEDLRRATAEVVRLMELSPEQGSADADRLHVLALVVKDFEAKHYPIAPPDPIEAILFAVEQREVSAAALEAMAGGPFEVRQMLDRERSLSLTQIRRLHAGLGIALDTLVQTYPLKG